MRIAARKIFDGTRMHVNAALIVEGGIVQSLERCEDGEGILAPGFVDLQVNGGGGVQFNDAPSSDAIAIMAKAHLRYGTTTLFPTLISDTPEKTDAAIAAAEAAGTGLHLEGPHLAMSRKGAHSADLVRPMEQGDLERLIDAAGRLPALLVTIAPEAVSLDQLRAMVAAGIRVSLGHTDCDAETARTYMEAGARLVTHLFNAMSPLHHRAPGLVGAALDGPAHAGLIADGVHVDPVAMRVALRGKCGPGRIFVVTDAMAPFGTDMMSFTLNDRRILRRAGRLELEDGTLAGADIDLPASLRILSGTCGVDICEALAMVTRYPAEAAGLAGAGTLTPGARFDAVRLNEDFAPVQVWREGMEVRRG